MARTKHDVMWTIFVKWRHQLDVRQLQCLVEFIRMLHRGQSFLTTIDLFHCLRILISVNSRLVTTVLEATCAPQMAQKNSKTFATTQVADILLWSPTGALTTARPCSMTLQYGSCGPAQTRRFLAVFINLSTCHVDRQA